jgi:hypothetical protein
MLNQPIVDRDLAKSTGVQAEGEAAPLLDAHFLAQKCPSKEDIWPYFAALLLVFNELSWSDPDRRPVTFPDTGRSRSWKAAVQYSQVTAR